MQGPGVGMILTNLIPWFLIGLVWIGWAALAVWGVLLLRRMGRSLEAISRSIARLEAQREHR